LLLGRPGDPIAGDLLVEGVLTAHMRGSGIGPSCVMVMLGITEDNLDAGQRPDPRCGHAMNR